MKLSIALAVTFFLVSCDTCISQENTESGKEYGIEKIAGNSTQPEVFLWWEAENPLAHNFPATEAFAPASPKEKEMLSNGKWLQTDKGANVTASWQVELPQGGEYDLWVRKFWQHGPFYWRFNDGEERLCGRNCGLSDSVDMRQFVCANWVNLGKIDLKKGKNTLSIKATSDTTAIGFDCWLLTNREFAPNGAMKPGEKYNRSEPGWFAFEPDRDVFSGDALLDLRGMNQKYAGADGFVRGDGDSFIFEKSGEKVKFWAVNAIVGSEKNAVDHLARELAKRGVNMVRIHSGISDASSPDPSAVDMKYLDNIHYFVAAMAKQGIYTKISFFFPLWFSVDENWKIPGYNKADKDKRHPMSLLFFHPRMQEIYKNWAKIMLTTKNPYTGKNLGEDPALAILETVNEDGMFFWTFHAYKNPSAESMIYLEKLFGQWASKKHGSVEKAIAEWGSEKRPARPDTPQEGRLSFYDNAGLMGGFDWARLQRNEKRIHDQVQFLTEHQKNFYTDMKNYFKTELGYKGLVSASNWQTVDNSTLGALEEYTYTGCDVMDRHAYFSSEHKGEGASWSVRKGHEYSDRSGLLEADSITKGIQYGVLPQIVSEYNYPMPNRFRAEGVFLAAVYGSLSGTDGFLFFRIESNNWAGTNSKFPVYTPVVLGQFPALSFIYRRGLLKEGPVVADWLVSLKDLYELKGTPAAQEAALDDFRKKDIPPGKMETSQKTLAFDPLSYYVGRIKLGFSPDINKSEMMNISEYISKQEKTVKSATGEIELDWGKGLCLIDAPQAQGACGFLKNAGSIRLKDITLEIRNEYATAVAISLDGKKLSESSKILLQVMTEDRNYGWKTSGEKRKTILDFGQAPIIVKDIEGKISIRHSNSGKMKITSLDMNGYAKKEISSSSDTEIVLFLEKNVIYYMISKDNK